MKVLILIFKAIFAATVGYAIYAWDNFTYTKATTSIDSSLSMEEVWEEYKVYWLKHEPNMTAPETCLPHTEEEIIKLEDTLNIKLPEDLKISFKTVNHSSKKCDDNLFHSWFGSKTGISLFSPKEMIYKDKSAFYNVYVDSATYTIYDGEITPYPEKNGKWINKLVPIVHKYDITIFMDLRENIGDEYGQIVAYMPTFEGMKNEGKPRDDLLKKLTNYTPNPNNSFNNFVFIAKDYKTFMQLMLEEIKENGEIKDRYFTNLFNLKEDYFW
jgi:cell wall assembly regulator SMI1